MTRLAEELRVLLAAVTFLTRIPGPRWLGYDPAWLARSTVYFPIVGAVVGLAGALVYSLALGGWPPFIAAALSTIATVWLTGAFHEDALADACDGFGGGWDRAQILTIMKDSRIGSYGAVGLMLVVLTKVGALATMADAGRALVVAHVLARWSSLPLIYVLPYVRDDGAKSKPFAASVTTPRLVVGSVFALGTAFAALRPGAAAGVIVCAVAITAIAGRFFRRRLGGMTGDCLGAANQIVELGTYLVLASTWLRR